MPASWSPKANLTMNAAFSDAANRAGFATPDRKMPTIFMVNEAEAAATHALKDGGHDLKVLQVARRFHYRLC